MHNCSFFRFLLFLLILLSTNLKAQDPVSIRYSVENGLPSNEVYEAYEDKEGNIWFATDHGISRFDGYTFKNFSTKDGLSDNTVFGFRENSDGVVYMRCVNGSLSCMANGRIFPYPHNDKLLEALDGSFLDDFEIGDGNQMYFRIYRGGKPTYVLDLPSGTVRRFGFPVKRQAGLLQTQDPEHRIYVSSDTSDAGGESEEDLTVYDQAAGKFWSMSKDHVRNFSVERFINITLPNDVDIVTVGNQLFRIEGNAFTHRRELEYRVTSLQKDRHDQVWLTTERGLEMIDDQLRPIWKIFEKEYIMGMLYDSNGNYWICTTRGVLLVRNMQNLIFDQVGTVQLGNVRRLKMLDSTLYVLYGRGELASFRIPSSTLEPVIFPGAEMNGYHHDFLPIRKAGSNDVLFSWGVYPEDALNELLDIPRACSTTFARRIRQQGDKILIASVNGLQVFDLNQGPSDWNCLFRDIKITCNSVLYDEKRYIWAGTNKGLYRVHGDTMEPYLPKEKLPRCRVTDLALLNPGEVAVSTRGEGILLIKNGRIVQIDEDNGLPTNLCNTLFSGPSGLWVCSNQGLTLLRRKPGLRHFEFSGDVQNYTVLDGLPSNKVNDVVEFGGKTYIGTENGLAIFAGTNKGNTIPRIKIEQISVDGRIISKGAKLSTNEDNLQIQFRGQKLASMGNFSYRYMLEGYDPAWRNTSENFVNYYNLPPGRYTFRVTGAYPYTPENPHEDSVVFDLPYKLHETTVFRVMIALLGIGLLILAFWQYYRAYQRRLRGNMNRLHAEIKALRSQMRPHFIFNALNSIQQLILLNDNATAHIHLARFAKLMRTVLDASNHESIAISLEIEILQMYMELEKLRFGDNFTYAIELQQDVDWESAQIPPMLLQPILENAIWHGLRLQKTNPKAWLRFRREPDGSICCEVEDNGIGRKATAKRSSISSSSSVGLANINDRIKLINTIQPNSIAMEIIDLADGETALGTLVKLHLYRPTYARNKA